MPFLVHPNHHCAACPLGQCLEDRRLNRVRGRETDFRLNQNKLINCGLGGFVPGSDGDPDPNRPFTEYQEQLLTNAFAAGGHLFGDGFRLTDQAIAKVQGDIYQNLQAAVLWNATAVWNRFMDTGVWASDVFAPPVHAVPTPLRKIAVMGLPRGYDATRLFNHQTRAALAASEAALIRRELRLGMSSPDIVGVRIPHPTPREYAPFLGPLPDLSGASLQLLERVHQDVEGTLDGHQFLFAIAVKRSVRSDRLYQPLYEANVLKYLIQEVLRGAAFRFSVHVESAEGADVEGRYRAPSLASLLRGGEPARAIDRLYIATHPRATAQAVMDDYTLFPH